MSVSIDWSRMGPGYFFKNFPWDSSMWFWGRTTAVGNRESIQLCKQDGDVKTLKKKKKKFTGQQCERLQAQSQRRSISAYAPGSWIQAREESKPAVINIVWLTDLRESQ